MSNTITPASHDQWLDQTLPSQTRLTQAVITIIENILRSKKIDFLTVTGRTKTKQSALEKIKRKGYLNPAIQMTDLSGIRIVVYFESDVLRVSEMIDEAFNVDTEHSLNKDNLLSTNQIGYRSVHYVCDLGTKRESLLEFEGLAKLKFEFQVRTVLQHAWAELAHDRNYKFSGKLPKDLERKLFLYAGLLEIADKGFDETSKEIDNYSKSLQEKTSHGDLDLEITSLSLSTFVNFWAKSNAVPIIDIVKNTNDLNELIEELSQFGIKKLEALNNIIPHNYSELIKETKQNSTIYGLVRDWMLIKDWRRFKSDVDFNWVMDSDGILDKFFSDEEFAEFHSSFEWDDPTDYFPEEH